MGFKEILDGSWRSCFWHEALKVLLVVYVDDFKAAGPTAAVDKAWQLIRSDPKSGSGIRVGRQEPLGLYLGCRHIESTRPHPTTKVMLRVVEYDMSDFLRSCVERYTHFSGHTSLKPAGTPFLEEQPHQTESLRPSDIAEVIKGMACACFDCCAAAKGACKKSEFTAADGKMKPHAAKVLMKILYAARMARFDLLRPVNALARMFTKWDADCDNRLHRLV